LATTIGGNRNSLAAETAPVARTPCPIIPTPEDLERHAAFVAKLKDPVWATLEDAAPAAG
jgi:DNA polymerase-3 subunit epsilon